MSVRALTFQRVSDLVPDLVQSEMIVYASSSSSMVIWIDESLTAARSKVGQLERDLQAKGAREVRWRHLNCVVSCSVACIFTRCVCGRGCAATRMYDEVHGCHNSSFGGFLFLLRAFVQRGWRNGGAHDLLSYGSELESRLCHLCSLLQARKTRAHANDHGFSWAVRTLEKASPQ